MGEIIKEYTLKIKALFKEHEREIWLSIIVILVSFSSFELGRISVREVSGQNTIVKPITEAIKNGQSSSLKPEAKVLQASAKVALEEVVSPSDKNSIVASKNGTRYYFSYCSGVSRISEKNKIYFKNIEEAEKAGYTLASGCK